MQKRCSKKFSLPQDPRVRCRLNSWKLIWFSLETWNKRKNLRMKILSVGIFLASGKTFWDYHFLNFRYSSPSLDLFLPQRLIMRKIRIYERRKGKSFLFVALLKILFPSYIQSEKFSDNFLSFIATLHSSVTIG